MFDSIELENLELRAEKFCSMLNSSSTRLDSIVISDYEISISISLFSSSLNSVFIIMNTSLYISKLSISHISIIGDTINLQSLKLSSSCLIQRKKTSIVKISYYKQDSMFLNAYSNCIIIIFRCNTQFYGHMKSKNNTSTYTMLTCSIKIHDNDE